MRFVVLSKSRSQVFKTEIQVCKTGKFCSYHLSWNTSPYDRLKTFPCDRAVAEEKKQRNYEEEDDLKISESANCVIPHLYASTGLFETSRCFHPLNQALKVRPLSSLTLKPADP